MRILIVGSGAREDALSWRLAASPSCAALVHAPGNAGTATRGENWPLAATDARGIAQRAVEAGIDLVVLGPETAIAAGVGDRCREAGLAVFGPDRSGGRLETSKIYAKRFMERSGVPTARFRVAHTLAQAEKALAEWRWGGVVVKADGLAAGKGVVVCDGVDEARTVVRDWYGAGGIPGGGADVLLEERLRGREVSVFAIADGRAMVPFAAACDYKRAGDGDRGPNTGGMGAYSPPAGFPEDLLEIARERIIAPTLRGLLVEGESYRGVLYCGLMWTDDGPYVVEYNARFGDPETQVIVPRLQGDLAAWLRSAADGALELDAARVSDEACVGVVIATKAYPYENTPVRLSAPTLPDGVAAFWGGSARVGDEISSPGGRVVTITARGADVAAARARAYEAVRALREPWTGAPLAFRSDIAAV